MVSLLLSTSLLVSAGPKQKKVDNWIDASVKQKSELRASLVKANMPIMSAWIKAKQKAVPMSADLTAGSVGACYGRRTGWYGLGLGYMGERPFNQGGR